MFTEKQYTFVIQLRKALVAMAGRYSKTITFRIDEVLYKRIIEDSKSKKMNLRDYFFSQLDPECDLIKIVDEESDKLDIKLAELKGELAELKGELKVLRAENRELKASEKKKAEK